MDWVDDDGGVPPERSDAPNHWRESRGDVRGELRTTRKALEDRLDTWVSRGRELVDGVSGTRPGTRPAGRGTERPGPGGRPGLDGLGRWVEGRLDWLLDDREDWREPWQEAGRSTDRWDATSPQATFPSNAPFASPWKPFRGGASRPLPPRSVGASPPGSQPARGLPRTLPPTRSGPRKRASACPAG
ncbi:MAG: hypothetical protein ACKOOH_09640, partial [Cyanobium sp.]